MSGLMNNLNGSKLAAAQSAWAANPDNHGQDFNFATYAKSNLPSPTSPTPMMHIEDDWGDGSRAVKDYYEWFKNEVEAHGLANVHSYIFNP